MEPLKITYLLEDTAMAGGVRVVLAQADALIARGHRVRIVTKGLPLTWRAARCEWVYVDNFLQYDASDDDFVVATFWLTVGPANHIAPGRAVHLCQGYEGALDHYRDVLPQIEETYSLPIPKLVVTQSLVPVCERFSSDVTWIGQIVDDEFYRDVLPRENVPLRVLIYGQAQADFRGVAEGYGAVAHARWFHQQCELVRVSTWMPAKDEPLESVQEFHVGLTSAEMTRLVHSCDILIGPNHREEGFGLPAAEAMAAGLACILTSIPSYLSFDSTHDYALFAPEGNAVELGERLIELLGDDGLRRRLRERGREVARQWRAPLTAGRLEAFFESRRAGVSGAS